ncbi:MAG: cyclopropane-fatty-acyl-phospholipid synthase [Actinomycetota bacterium]|nr:cyclopropane-fatty-acyl-phospholipid synthase [Actinomycetota bacterium]
MTTAHPEAYFLDMSVASQLEPLVRTLVPGGLPITIKAWDGSTLGPGDAAATLVIKSPTALRRLMWAPNELGLGRAYVAGDLDIEGDVYAALTIRSGVADADQPARVGGGGRGWLAAVAAARRLRALGRPLPPPKEESRLSGRRHSKERDAAAVAHHYDVGNDFYRIVLGQTLTYSCAYFETADTPLEVAQEAKYELICRKLGLQPGMRLLDVGCGWGGMVLHAAKHHGVTAVGVTLSRHQQELAAKRVAEAGLEDRVEIRFQDYRDITDGPYDAISSIGMFEHVGLEQLRAYFACLFELVRPEGRVLNHAISRPANGGEKPRFDKHSFIERYVFPDGELHEVGAVVTGMQEQGFEVRDVESLREHYAKTLRHWVTNLDASWDEAVAFAGEARARIWKLYMAASAVHFEANRTNLHQVLGVKSTEDGRSAMPLTRRSFLA